MGYFCFGIDLGTPNPPLSSNHNPPANTNPGVFVNLGGEQTTHSETYLDNIQRCIRRIQRNRQITSMENAFYDFKKVIGRKFNDSNKLI